MNMQAIMAQAKKMQKDVEKAKEEIDKTVFKGQSEWVVVEMTGNKRLVSVNIVYDQNLDADDKEMLEDMIKIAMNNTLDEIDKVTEKTMNKFGGGALNGLF